MSMVKEPAVVNCRGIHTDAIVIQIQAEALSSIITLKILKISQISLKISLKNSTKFIQQNHK